jgi:hypothetical protein
MEASGPPRQVSFRVTEQEYALIQGEAEAMGAGVAHFARVATLTRTALAAHRRGYMWASDEGWDDIFRSIEALETHDVALRAKLAAKRRESSDASFGRSSLADTPIGVGCEEGWPCGQQFRPKRVLRRRSDKRDEVTH